MRIGIDLDNTLIRYDGAFVRLARDMGLVDGSVAASKRAVRTHVRARDDGETDWRRLQGRVYGAGLGFAALFDGAGAFLTEAARRGHAVLIVSHKTRFSDYDPARVDLREAARGWLSANGFFDPRGYGVSADDVFFEDTRDAKVARIAALDCDWFVDDLEEVLTHPGFPGGVERVLFDPDGTAPAPEGVRVAADWADVFGMVLDG